MKRLTKEIEEKQKDISNSDMRVELKEDYYNLMKQDEVNNFIFLPEVHDMYKLNIHKNYYSEDEQAVLHDMIEDLEDEIKMLKEVYKNRYVEKYQSYSKKRDDWER